MATSPLGLWVEHYATRPQQPYDDPASYLWGAEYLAGCRTVEDWGCGYGWFRRTLRDYSSATCRNLDGSASEFTDAVVDLRVYRSTVEGIFLRGVLEHNHDWQPILRHALASFTHRMMLVCFTPFSGVTENLYNFEFPAGGTVPVLALSHAELTAIIQQEPQLRCEVTRRQTATEFGVEHLFQFERCRPPPRVGSLTVLCTTTGRPSLTAMLGSLKQQHWEPDDEVLLVQDGSISDAVRALWDAAQLPGHLMGLPNGPHADCGETPRNLIRPHARGSYIVNLDDDDCLAPGALHEVRRAIQSDPGAFFFFQVDLPDGRRFWDYPELRWGNVGSSMFVAPTDCDAGKRGNFAGGDFYYILETLARNPQRPVRWIDQAIFQIRPHAKGRA